MFSFFGPKYNSNEQQYFDFLGNNILLTGVTNSVARYWSKRILDKAIKEAEAEGRRGKKDLGDEFVNNSKFMLRRRTLGLSDEDILKFWNRDYVWILAEEDMNIFIRFTYGKALIKSGVPSEEVTNETWKYFVSWGDPEKPHPRFPGEDSYIFPEFVTRHEAWRSQYSLEKEREIASHYSTYNAMMRDLIRRGEM